MAVARSPSQVKAGSGSRNATAMAPRPNAGSDHSLAAVELNGWAVVRCPVMSGTVRAVTTMPSIVALTSAASVPKVTPDSGRGRNPSRPAMSSHACATRAR